MGLFGLTREKSRLATNTLKGRDDRPFELSGRHAVNGRSIVPPFPDGMEQIVVGMGCFWGAERLFWHLDGVWVTAVGYAGGTTPNPTYEEVCSGSTNHTEVVLIVHDPKKIDLERLLKVFWESHDPTQGMRQGNDVGTQYRSAIYWYEPGQRAVAETTRNLFQHNLAQAGHRTIQTEIKQLDEFYYAEEHHQQYLHKNPWGYCGIAGTGVSCPIDTPPAANADRGTVS